jgi:type II secretory pathway component GspD/PulD (secretin)
MEEMLIKLLTSTISPQAWNNMGGPGTIEYFPLTMSLVINQSPDIQEQVADLLTALRRLQDQEVAVEIRFISIAEDFYERIGVDFNLNIKTDKNTQRFEPQIQSGQYKPAGYINDPNFDRMIAGITPSGNFTSDLDIPIKQSSYPLAMPSFGGYSGLPGAGGLAMGLAFLSDIQVFLFMEAVQGDRRTNVMQAPKLTMFNGQNANIIVAENQFFVTGVNVSTLINGNITFAPQVQAFPFGVYMNVQPLISADRRTVRLNIPVTLTNLVPGPVSLFPVVVPIFPSSSALSTNPGDPITFTQYIQQPVINTIAVQTTVSVPDGGTVLMGGIKRLSESRNEYGPPVLSKIPYLNRLFRNNSYGREAESLLIMVTPRIIIQEEEEFYQTGYKAPPNVNP